MAPEDDSDFYDLPFSAREGKAPPPEPMRPEHIPKKFRQLSWLFIDTEISKTSYLESGAYAVTGEDCEQFHNNKNVGSIISSYKFEILGQFHDDIGDYDPQKSRAFFKEMIEGGNYHRILTLIEFVLRHEYCSEELRESLLDAFDEAPIAYFVEEINGLPTIIPRASCEAGKSTQQAIRTIQGSGMDGAATHLRQAAENINAKRYADSIVDSIHAVESVARRIAPRSKTLGDALKSLEKKGLLKNSQLKKGFEQIYAYTNNEEGVRHPLVFQDSTAVGLDEAMFMFGACASFAAYLVSKHRQTETG